MGDMEVLQELANIKVSFVYGVNLTGFDQIFYCGVVPFPVTVPVDTASRGIAPF